MTRRGTPGRRTARRLSCYRHYATGTQKKTTKDSTDPFLLNGEGLAVGRPISPPPRRGSGLAVGRRNSEMDRDRGGGMFAFMTNPIPPSGVTRRDSRRNSDLERAIANGMTYAPMTPPPIVPSGYAPMTPPQAQASFGPRAGGVTNPRAPGASSSVVRTAFADDDNGNQTMSARPRWRSGQLNQYGLAHMNTDAERRTYENAAKRRLRAAGFDA